MLEQKIVKAAKILSYTLRGIKFGKDDNSENFLQYIESLINKYGKKWYLADVAPEGSIIPCTFHFLGGGMFLRNHMRDIGYGEEYFEVDCIDDLYTRVAEVAVLGHEL